MVEDIPPKSFDDLKAEVGDRGICGECGGCVSFCSAHDLEAIELPKGGGPPRYKNKDKCQHDGICYLVCPQIRVLKKELDEKFDFKPRIGNYAKVASVQAVDDAIKKKATDGGAVTAILAYLLQKKLIDGAMVAKKSGPFNRVPFLALSRDDLLEAAGSHFDVSGHVTELKNYNTFISAVTALRRNVGSDTMKLAVVATPCQIGSIRRMQMLNILPSHVVEYTLGLFCNMNFKFDAAARERMEKKFGFSFDDVENMNIKDEMILNVKGKGEIRIGFDDLKDYARPACFACPDFTNVYADISFGGLGSEDGYTTVLTRTKKGQDIFREARTEGFIVEPPEQNTSVKKSAMLANLIGFSERKLDRYKEKMDSL
ncbi:MAG: Coenzyme F420 hydrogenase/dehydrogenase, beta subunit C-terminal domain [Candidatus Hodarchaeota archaeon]